MNSINVRDLSYLFNQSTAKSFSMICSARGLDPAKVLGRTEDGKPGPVPLDFSCTVEHFDRKHDLILHKCIHSVKTSLIKDKACMETLYAWVKTKAKMKKEGSFPETVNLPPVLKKILDPADYATLVDIVTEQLVDTLTKKHFSIKIA